jgi:hypothetical protein
MSTQWHWSWTIPLVIAGVCAAAGPGPAPSTATAPAPLAAPPASSPASAPAPVTADYSTPAAAAKTLLTAINKGNFAVVYDALTIPASHKTEIETLLAAMEASSRLQQAATTRFLTAGTTAFGTPTPETLAAQLQAVAAGPLTLTGDAATLLVAADTASNLPGGTVEFKKIGGDWKIDGAAFFKLATEPADKTAARVELARQLTTLTDTMTQEIAAGKFFSATDAFQEYWTRYLTLTHPASTATSSAPTTSASTSPATTPPQP